MPFRSCRRDRTPSDVSRLLERNATCSSNRVSFIGSIALPRCTFISHSSNRHGHRCTLFLPRLFLRTVLPGRVARGARVFSLADGSGNFKNRAILGIDVGTSATKAALCFIDERGRLGPVSRVAHETTSPGNLQITQRIDDWLLAAISASREALTGIRDDVEIAAIAATGQMQDLIAVGPNPPALLSSDAILYSDARAQQAAEELSVLCGTRIAATSILAKLSLLPTPSASTPATYSLLLGAADYIIHAFSAWPKPTVTDATTVSTTGLTTSPHRCYNSMLLASAGFSAFEAVLPSILPSPCVTGRLCASVAAQLGRPDLAGTPLVHGCGDAFSATAGAERDSVGGAYVYCGSSGWVGGTTSLSPPRARSGVFALGHAADEHAQLTLASLSAAGANVAFAAERLVPGADVEEVGRLAGEVPVGANGVVYSPYVTGRRCPSPSDNVSGALVGLRASSRRADVARAVVEGVAFAFAQAAGTLAEGVVGEQERVRMVGGGAKCEPLVRGIAALVAKGGVVRMQGEDGAVGIVGAARTAARVVCGEVADWWTDGEVVVVGEKEQRRWEEAFQRWRRVVEALEMV